MRAWTTSRTRLPLRIVVTDDLERSRVTVFFRLLLAIPHLVVVGLWGVAACAVSIILWLALLVEGKAPRTLQSFVVVVPPLLGSGERLRPPGGGAVPAASAAATDTRSTSRSIPRPHSRAAGLPPASCSRSRPCSSPRRSAAVRGSATCRGLPPGAPTPAWSTGWSVGRPRRDGGLPGAGSRRSRGGERPEVSGTWSPTRSATRRRRRVPAARHRPLPDVRPRPGHTRSPSCRPTRSGSS